MYITVPVFVSQPSSSDGRESEEEEEGEKREAAALRLQLREKTAEAVGKTWPSCAETQGIVSFIVFEYEQLSSPIQLHCLAGPWELSPLLSLCTHGEYNWH